MKGLVLVKYCCLVILFSAWNCAPVRPYLDGVYTGKIKNATAYGWSPELTIVVKDQRLIAATFDYQADAGVYPNSQEIKKQVRDLGKINPEVIYYALIKQLLDRQAVPVSAPAGAVRITGHFKRLAGALLAKALLGETEPLVLEEQPATAVPAAATRAQGQARALAVVSNHQLATRAGMEVLEAGGTAADAAFAVAAVLTVVEPWFSSVLGGGTWALYYDQATRRVYALDGTGPAGSKVKAEAFAGAAYAGTPGMHQAVVPGAWAGWMAWLKRFGSRPLTELFKRALQYAEQGVAVSAEFALWLKREEAVIRRWPDAAFIYLPRGRVPRAGELIYQPQLARTCEELIRIYETARIYGEKEAFDTVNDYFYRGPLAEKIVHFMEKKGGLLVLADFNNFYTGFVEPLSSDYKGIRVYQNPPNSQGITMLLGLNILKGIDFSRWQADSPDTIHYLVEAAKLAHADKYYYVGDPKFVELPLKQLLSEAHAATQRARINRSAALAWPLADVLPPAQVQSRPEYTTTFSLVDRYGNAAAVTTSLGASFLVAGETGIIINNWMRMADLEKTSPNLLLPGKKVRHTGNPYLALYKGNPYILGGHTGVDTQPQGQMQQFIYVVEFGLTPQAAVDRLRFATGSFPSGVWPHKVTRALFLEAGFPGTLQRELAKRGHKPVTSDALGIANMLVIRPGTGETLTGADPRSSTSLGLVKELPAGD